MSNPKARKGLLALTILCSASLVVGEPLSDAENVCNISMPFKKDVVIQLPVKYEIKYQSMCGVFPCTKTKFETRVDEQIKTILMEIEKPACCPGYVETPDRQCAPVCQRSCNNGGKCIAPNQCQCSISPGEWTPGFVGSSCSRFICLGENRWGSRCDRECDCPLNAYCSANNGKCVCNTGFRGANCTEECEPKNNHPDCEESNKLPPILEPDANLISDNSNFITSRQRSEALVLEKLPDETLQDDRGSFGANCLVGALSCASMLLLIALLLIKRRYDRLKSEVCYSSGLSVSPSSIGGGGDYSDSQTYDYASGQRSVVSQQVNDAHHRNHLAKNLSFASATRQALSGDELSSAKSNEITRIDNTQAHDKLSRNKLIVNPLVESHLIRSQKQAEENLYSDVVKVDFSDRPLPNPADITSNTTTSISIQLDSTSGDESHIYQVPRSNNVSITADSQAAADTSTDSIYKSFNDNEDQIYEEIKPRSPK